MRIFGKNVKIPSAVTPAYYDCFVEFISCAKCVLLPSKKEKNNYSKYFLFLFHPHFCTYFALQTLQFLLTGGARISLAPGRRLP